MNTSVRRTLIAAFAALALAGLTAGQASAATYWISPYLTSNQDDYLLSGCYMSSRDAPGSPRTFETGGDTSGKIGIRGTARDGTYQSIQWGDERAWTGETKWWVKYKLYHY